MCYLQNLTKQSPLKWAFLDFTKNCLGPWKTETRSTVPPHILRNPRLFGTKAAACKPQETDEWFADEGNVGSWSRVACREAQDALLDYLHSTRSLQFVDAENISRNSPRFLGKLLKRVDGKEGVGPAVSRFLRYHPINEFEPFFESMGLGPGDYSSLLPRNLMFLSDYTVLLDNYRVFSQYGFASNKIGKIYKEANEVFGYPDGVLLSRLQSIQDVVLDQSTVIKLVGSRPSILIGDGIHDVLKVVKEVSSVGVTNGWFVENLSEDDSYDWKHMLDLLCLFERFDCKNELLGGLLRKHPTVLLRNSGRTTATMIALLSKFGASKTHILSLFLQFPEIEVHEFVSNLRRSYDFLTNIEMEAHIIARLFREHPSLLGSCYLKSVKTALNSLNSGKKRLCEIIDRDPQELKKLTLGLKVVPLPSSKECTEEKTKFLSDLGFVKDSTEMKRALKRFRGRAGELQQRFDCLVAAGFHRSDVVAMVKLSPQVINQTKEVLESKIDYLVNGLGYPLAALAAYPSSLSYAVEKVRLRFSMCAWLREQGAMNDVALSTILACSEKQFVKEKVNRHPKGLEVYERLKNEIYSDCIS